MSLPDELRALARSLCPEYCPRCGDESLAGFCGACSRDFARVPCPCPRCGLPGGAHACPADDEDWQLDAVLAPFLYAEPLSLCLQRLKFARQRPLGRALGLLLVRELALLPIRCQQIVPVPLHRRRLRERTFNQADEIARPIARQLRLATAVAGISRTAATPAQTGLGRDERLRNLAQAFAVRRRLDDARIAIVDDVVTTGATVNALAKQLKLAGARHVEAWAVARAAGTQVADAQPTRNR